ncbi:MAG: hypothetical protein Q8Q33_00265 [Chlamydiota bacterium]|nr:hypothetical protein [Chlamydiota bacterium]
MKNDSGLTIYELALTLIVIALISFIAVIKYNQIVDVFKYHETRRRLSQIQSAVILYRIHEIIRGRDAFPDLDKIQDNDQNDGSLVFHAMGGDLPDNLFSTGTDRDAVRKCSGKPESEDDLGAWAYDPKTGLVYPDTVSAHRR